MKLYKKLSALLCLAIFATSLNFNELNLYATDTNDTVLDDTEDTNTENEFLTTPSINTDTLNLSSETAVLIDAKSGIIIYEKDKDRQMYPASITKVLTALLALDAVEDFSQRIEFSHQAVFTIPAGSSHIAMDEGETLSYNEALLALMLASANEVSNAIAEDLAENNEEFGLLMTQRAHSLGAVNSNFTNPHGLHHQNHYTTAYDMALITREAIQYEKFIELISTTSTTIPPTERKLEERPLNNSNRMIINGNTYYYEHAVGGKTGFTNEAGHTLVMYGIQDGIELISVVMFADNSASAYNDTRTLLEYGFEQFTDITIFDHTSYSDIINVISEADSEGNIADLGIIEIGAKESVTMTLPNTFNSSRIVLEKNIPYQTQPPVIRNQLLGTLSIRYDGVELANVELFSNDDFELPVAALGDSVMPSESGDSSGFLSKVLHVFGIVGIAVLAVLAVIAIAARVLRHQRRKKRRALRQMQQYRRRSAQRYRYRDQ